MNIYALIPLVATIAYIPLLISTVSARPWRREHKLFLAFLVPAILWSLTDYVYRGNFFLNYNYTLVTVIILLFFFVGIQLHCFLSSYYPPGKSRWLPFAYGMLGVNIILAALGYIPNGFGTAPGLDIPVPEYGYSLILLAGPLLILVARNAQVLFPRLMNQKDPVVYNQTACLLLCLGVITVFVLAALFPFGKLFPISHLGNAINAIILSYAVVGHNLVDIRFVIRRGFIWLCIAVIGLTSFWVLLFIFHEVFRTELTPLSFLTSSISSIVAVIIIYRLRDIVSRFMGKAFYGQSYYYREKLVEFADKIHNVFSLKEQGGELLSLVIQAIGCRKAGLLFLDAAGDFDIQLMEPPGEGNPLSRLKLRKDNPVVAFLTREDRPLTRENLAILPEFMGLWQQEKETIEANKIELFVPLISRERLIGILVLDRKRIGRYNLEDFSMLEDVTNRVAVSMEKEYLREQLKQREEELSVINRSNAVITSSLDIQMIYDSFIKELKRVIDVDWTAIAVIEDQEVCFMALSTEVGSPWNVGERIPLKGSGTEWVSNHQKTFVDSDLSVETHFSTAKYHLQHSIRSIAYLPLIIADQVIGTLVVASRKPDAYSARHIKLLEQLASQIAMPIENARLYARTERLARVDSLTGLLNRRSMDEMLTSEIGRHSRYGGVFSLIILDLDSFKSLNDSYGHLAGDELLRQIGLIMKTTIREADQAFRYGGDEFAVLLPQTSMEAALKVAERIRQQTFARMEIGSTPISISLGLACWPIDGVTPVDIMAAADRALYQAKRSGGNRSHCSSVDLKSICKRTTGPPTSQDSGTLSTIFALAATVDSRGRLTQNHSKQVHDYAVAIGEGMGMNPLEINRLGTCALLHDIGKIGISDEILNKQEKLTEHEWEVIKSHPALGASIVSHSSQLSQCVSAILHHHERYNGEGYPDGLKGEAIPLESRILAVADAFAAMTSARVYSHVLSCEAALEELKRESGKQFDPKMVEIFLMVVQKVFISPEQSKIGGEKN